MAHPPDTRASHTLEESAIFAIERPDPKLWNYYLLACLPLLIIPPVAVLVGLVHWFRYHTLRYRFDTEGIHMRWGILFRREIILNYARIQDIHLVSNLVERWLGLARIQIQTASGSASPEMTIEGICEFEALRDFLYARMRGTRDHAPTHRNPAHSAHSAHATQPPPLLAGTTATPRSTPALPSRFADVSGADGDRQVADRELIEVLREIAGEVRALREERAVERQSGLNPIMSAQPNPKNL